MLIQLPRANSDLLMLAPSIIRMPRFPVLAALSEPARSMRESLPTLISDLMPESFSLYSHMIYSTACDLEEVSLAPVAS
jgi:hypothetical protein